MANFCSNTEVIKAWNGSDSAAEAAEKLGIKPTTINARIRALHDQGIGPLKQMRGPGRAVAVDVDELKRVAAETLPEGAELYVPVVRQRAAATPAATPAAPPAPPPEVKAEAAKPAAKPRGK